MNVLLISDNPHQKTFGQIWALKKRIQEINADVDLLAFSNEGVFLNQEKVGAPGASTGLLEKVLKSKAYTVVAISLTLKNLRMLLPEKEDILNLIEDILPETAIFVFGGPSILGRLRRAPLVHLYQRPGVDKLTKAFKRDLIEHIKGLKIASSRVLD